MTVPGGVRADSEGIAAGSAISNSGLVSGSDNITNRADVHIALDKVAAMSERELNQVEKLAGQMGQLLEEFAAMRVALIGNDKYGSTGLVQQVRAMADADWRQQALLGAMLLSEILQWAVILYLVWGRNG